MANYSGTITADNTAQTQAAADGTRGTMMLQNISSDTLFYAFNTTAVQDTPSIKLEAGDTHFWPVGFRNLICGYLSIIGPNSGAKFTIFDAKVMGP